MTVRLPYPPTMNLYWRHVGPKVLISSAGRAYKVEAGWLATSQGMRPVAGPVAVTIDVYRPRRIGDLDNTLKVILDSLKGIGYEDDKQIIRIVANRHDDAADPRAIVSVERAPDDPHLPPPARRAEVLYRARAHSPVG